MFENFTFKESTFDSVPEGTFITVLIGTEEVKTKYEKEKDTPAVAWKFRIVEGEQNGKVVSRVTGSKPTPSNGCGKILIGLLGKTPAMGETVSLKDCAGKKYIVQVVKNKDGTGTRVESVTRMP